MMNLDLNSLLYPNNQENPYHAQNWANVGLLAQSKKIQKIKHESSPQAKSQVKMEDPSEKLLLKSGYDTYLPGEREKILNSIKSRILEIENLNLRLEEENANAPEIDWVQHIKWLNFRDFNNVILEVIPSYKPYLSLDHQNLTQLRKKIKSWFKSDGKVETRGAPLILESELAKFLKETKEVLKTMKYRSFEELRTKMIPIIQKIHSETGRSFKGKNIFSKHFWCDFTNKHTEIGALWKDLPRSKSKKIGEDASMSPGEQLTPNSNLSVKLEQEWIDELDNIKMKVEEPEPIQIKLEPQTSF